MIKDLFNKKALAVVCAATLSISSVALAFTTSGSYDTATSGATSAPTNPPVVSEKPTTQTPVDPSVKPSETPVQPSNPPTLDTYVLVGELIGDTTWTPAKGVNMNQSADNPDVYTYIVKDVKAGAYEYQILKNGDWELKYSGPVKGFANTSEPNLKYTLKEAGDVTVTLDLKTMTVTPQDEVPIDDKTDLSAATVTLEKAKVTYNNAVQTPVVTKVALGDKELKAGEDYDVAEVSAKNVGKYTVKVNGKGSYKGEASAVFEVAAASISKATATVGAKTYTGKKLTSSTYTLKMKLGTKTVTLKKGTDYTVKAASLTNAGSANVKFTGKGNFSGTKTAKFTVKAQTLAKAKAKATVSSSKVYTGKKLKATVKVTVGKKALKANKDYTVSYSNNTKIGKATVTIKGKGNYTGSIKKTFKIVPGKGKIKKATNVKGNKIKVQISAVKGAKSYKVSYRVKGAKKWTSKTTNKTTIVLSKLKKNKTYQIKVSASAKSGKTTYTGAESSAKSVKVKK